MTKLLAKLIEKARTHQWTDAEREAQAKSFAWGNCAIDNPNVTREMIANEYDKMHPETMTVERADQEISKRLEAMGTAYRNVEAENVRLWAELHEWEESDAAKEALEPAFTEQIATLEARNQLLADALEKHYKPLMDRIADNFARAILECQIDGHCARCESAGMLLEEIGAALRASEKAGA
jgi:hypothetical protein